MLLCTFLQTCRHSYVCLQASCSYMPKKNNGSEAVRVRIHTAMKLAARLCIGGPGFNADVRIQAARKKLRGRTYIYSILFPLNPCHAPCELSYSHSETVPLPLYRQYSPGLLLGHAIGTANSINTNAKRRRCLVSLQSLIELFLKREAAPFFTSSFPIPYKYLFWQ
jgi:hypothetical protein